MEQAGTFPAGEWRRKAVHAGMGVCALLLRWLDWKMAAALAAAALLFNLFVMPRIGRGIYRDPSKARDPGIVAYPAAVLMLILLFRHELAAAAALWGMMAFGDPAATVLGTRIGGPRLPWNLKKTWSGFAAYFLVGTPAAAGLWIWTWADHSVRFNAAPLTTTADVFFALLPVVLLGGFLESLDTGLDDNWIPAVPCALALMLESRGLMPYTFWQVGGGIGWMLAALVNVLVATSTFALRLVTVSGAVVGAILGFVILACGGWPAYAVLWAFFLVATSATKLGYRRKLVAGTAQEKKGRRGGRHALANCGVAAALAFVAARAFGIEEYRDVAFFAFAGAFAAALADTLGTELGSLYGRAPISLMGRKTVPPGTPGAVSGAGLIGGLLGGAVIGVVAASVGLTPWSGVSVILIAGVLGSVAESLLADGARLGGRRVEHDFANAFNTFVGAAIAAEIAASIHVGRLYIPFES